jgi:hypothetical protein
MTALLPAELAWHATGRFYRAETDGALADTGRDNSARRRPSEFRLMI